MNRRIDVSALAPASIGVGFKPEHAHDAIDGEHPVGFFEVHAENYMGAGGPPHLMLEALRAHFPLSVHGVGLSIGGPGPLDTRHLNRLKRLVARYQPMLFSEHLAWSGHSGVFLNDLLPLPYTKETLQHVCEHVDSVQHALRTRMLLENPATYVAFESSDMSEIEFLRTVAARTGCGLLLDVNNVYVCAINHDFDPAAYIDGFPHEVVGEIHLAGHAVDDDGDAPLLIDTHGTPVAEAVWALYRRAVAHAGARPTLIEWDNDVPEFRVLASEAMCADRVMADITARPAEMAA